MNSSAEPQRLEGTEALVRLPGNEIHNGATDGMTPKEKSRYWQLRRANKVTLLFSLWTSVER